MTIPSSDNHSEQSRTSPTLKPCSPADFLLENHGSIFLLRPKTDTAIAWVEGHIGHDNGFQPYYPTVVIEPRFIADIVHGIQNDGLAVA